MDINFNLIHGSIKILLALKHSRDTVTRPPPYATIKMVAAVLTLQNSQKETKRSSSFTMYTSLAPTADKFLVHKSTASRLR